MLWNAFVLALREMRRNLLRSFLTVLGIVIGVASVITMVTVGNGATAKVQSDIGKLGSNLLMIRPGQHHGPGRGADQAPPFDIKDVEAIKREIITLAAVAPLASMQETAVYGNENWSTDVTGTNNDFFDVRDWDLAQGRKFIPTELRAGKAVCILGKTVVEKLFKDMDPIGLKIRIHKVPCEIIGVLTEKGQAAMGPDQDDIVLMPLRAFQRRISGNQDIDNIFVSVQSGESTTTAQHEIERLLRQRRHISPNEENDFRVRDMKEIANTLAGVTRTLTTLLGAVAMVSLLVGGIGIMNIMLVSVTERTKEIGTRLAIGALESEVLLQFLVEAATLSSFGGILGILLAIGASAGISRLLGVPFVLDSTIVVLAFFFSLMVGIIFGFFPARKAAALDPIEALRHD